VGASWGSPGARRSARRQLRPPRRTKPLPAG